MIIEARGLAHHYGPEKTLSDVDLVIDRAGITGLCAPNGEGKTTLLKLLAGLQFPSAGELKVLGHEPRERPLDLLQRLYFLPSEPHAPKWTPTKIAHYYAAFYPNFDHQLYRENLVSFRVDPNKPLDRVSFGQKRRAQLSFALATRAQVLLLDEPTIGLDIQGKDQFRRSLIAGTEAGQTIVIATHLLSEVENVLDHLLLLADRTIRGYVDLGQAAAFYSFNLKPVKPPYGDKGYARRVPGGWLTVHADGRPSNTSLDLETLYLALTDGRLVMPGTLQTPLV
ncbi:ATP-binding cassette domain-containing protein [Neolewinella antarctica]|uniref:ABC-2 type transport system ATP-binding protein n=1 Tax=Neolewinella antarctica TaxID=442734 RepID=A0ABX0X5X9_9BACT|nr:ABC transporter ATP-binding protein [Neolewinella antarctica]NJC24608.1 ABC-2 type transport system ATP-binding protein [Neolewinella antarctica]